MSYKSKVINKLKQFNVALNTSSIFQQRVSEKRSDIFARDSYFYSNSDEIWKNAYDSLKGLRTAYNNITVEYKSKLYIDSVNQGLRDAESEWTGEVFYYAVITVTNSKTGAIKRKFTIG